MKGSSLDVGFVLPVASQPRYWKRIGLLSSEDVSPRVFAFERDYVPRGSLVRAPVIGIGSLRAGFGPRRVFDLARAILPLYRGSSGLAVLYCFGLDVGILGWLVSVLRPRTSVAIEIGDVRPAMVGRGIRSRILRATERLLLRRAAVVVVTSARFRDDYLVAVQGLPQEKVVVIENKVDDAIRAKGEVARARACPAAFPIRIIYYGLIRCRKSWDMLKRLVAAAPARFTVEVWGRLDPAIGADATADLPAGMVYRGEYGYPEDLARIYAHADLVWIAHAHAVTNRNLARANRFYDACCFGTPMIAQVGSPDGAIVESAGLGVCINLDDPSSAFDHLLALAPAQIDAWRRRVTLLDARAWLYTTEHAELAARLRNPRNGSIGGRAHASADYHPVDRLGRP